MGHFTRGNVGAQGYGYAAGGNARRAWIFALLLAVEVAGQNRGSIEENNAGEGGTHSSSGWFFIVYCACCVVLVAGTLGCALQCGLFPFLTLFPFDMVQYYMEIVRWQWYGENFYKSKGSSRCPMVKAFRGAVLVDPRDVIPRAAAMEAELQRGATRRHNWLGPAMFNTPMCLHSVFSLGFKPSVHDFVRPWLDATLNGGGSSGGSGTRTWSDARVAEAARTFLDQKAGRLHFPNDAREFVVGFLASDWLGLAVPGEFDPAAFVAGYQANRQILAAGPEAALSLPVMNMKGKAARVKAQGAAYSDAIGKALLRYHPRGVLPAHGLEQCAAGALDALTFAGGLGVADLAQRTFAALALGLGDLAPYQNAQNAAIQNNHHHQSGSKRRPLRQRQPRQRLTPEVAELAVLETARLFPPVDNVAYERVEPFAGARATDAEVAAHTGREILGIGCVNVDPTVWGPDAAEFSLRRGKAAYDSPQMMAWLGHAPQRHCPARALSVALTTALVLELDRREWRATSPLTFNGGWRVGNADNWFGGYWPEDKFEIEWAPAAVVPDYSYPL